MPKLPAVTAWAALCFAVAPSLEAGPQSAESFEEDVSKTLRLEYLLSLPEGYGEEDGKSWPLVVFLHGAGERGADLEKVKIHGPPKRVEAGRAFPFILASPQCPEGGWWTQQPVLELVDHLEETLDVDPDRIYLTGLSMGGYGTWHFACQAPDRFAAIAPICGGGLPYHMRRITDLPVWAFHGALDRAVPLEESLRLVRELQKHGNESVKLTVYPEAGHDSWTESYDNPEFYDWLLSHARPHEN